MQHLINQSHRIDFGGFHGLFGVERQVTPVVHLLGEDARGMKIGEDNIAVEREQRLVEFVGVPRFPADMKFHHDSLSLRFSLIVDC